jgi:hypothetical protein
MITLTTPSAVIAVLGSTTSVNYDKMVIAPFNMDGVRQMITGNIRLTSTADTSMQPIIGQVQMILSSSELIIEVPQLDFYRRIVLTAGQKTAILAQIETAQKAIEDGLVALNLINGTRTAGV